MLFLISGALAVPVARVQAQAVSADQATNDAFQLMNNGKLAEAAEAFEDVIKKYPTAMSVADSQFRLGYLYFLLGDYAKSRSNIDKILAPPAGSDIIELGYALIPQVLAAKASKEQDADARKAGYEAAIKEFDTFLGKYPASTQVESSTYGRALCCFQIGKYDDAITSLRTNLKQFPQSETILESQFLLALGLMTQGGLAAQETAGEANPKADAQFDEAERLLNGIITKRSDIALINDAQFQLGELLTNRAIFVSKETRGTFFAKALTAYKGLLPKEDTIAAEMDRIKALRDRRFAALTAKNLPEMKQLDALMEHEMTKLEAVKAKGDLSVSAQIKIGQVFFQKEAYDEARVVFRQMQPFAEDDEQKKTLLYYLTLSYAQQSHLIPLEARQPLIDKAVERYNEFQGSYKGDVLADNLPFTMGGLFLAIDAEKAIQYYQEELQIYPKGRLVNDTLVAQANASIQLGKFDQALATFQTFLKQNPKKDLAAAAELGIANILKDTGKDDEAVAQFQKVASTYAGTPQAEGAAFWVGQLYLKKGDVETAIPALENFLKSAPKSELFPNAKYSLAQAYVRKKDTESALRIFKEVAEEFPKTEAAPYTYFERAAILTAGGKAEEKDALMKEFIQRYPDHDKVFFAYQSIAQDQIAIKRILDGIDTYTEMVDKHPKDPQAPVALLSVATLWAQKANSLGHFFTLNEDQRAEWSKAIANSVKAVERLITDYPESQQVANAAQFLLANQKLLSSAKLKTDEDVTKYFQDLASKFGDKPQTKSKLLFTLAAFTYEKDKAKAVEQMNAAYNPQLVYAAADMDLYGSALLEAGKVDESAKVYQKLAADFPNPDAAHPEKASGQVQEAQAIALYGVGRALQSQGKIAEAAEKFRTMKKLYSSTSPAKILEANYSIAMAAHAEKKDDEAIPLLVQVTRAPAAGVELRAKAMLLYAQIQEAKNEILPAIDQYLKIAMFYDSVPVVASEGLWCGGQLLEKQASSLPQSSQNPKDVTKPGQLRKALKAYKDMVAKYPNAAHINEAKARIAALEPTLK